MLKLSDRFAQGGEVRTIQIPVASDVVDGDKIFYNGAGQFATLDTTVQYPMYLPLSGAVGNGRLRSAKYQEAGGCLHGAFVLSGDTVIGWSEQNSTGLHVVVYNNKTGSVLASTIYNNAAGLGTGSDLFAWKASDTVIGMMFSTDVPVIAGNIAGVINFYSIVYDEVAGTVTVSTTASSSHTPRGCFLLPDGRITSLSSTAPTQRIYNPVTNALVSGTASVATIQECYPCYNTDATDSHTVSIGTQQGVTQTLKAFVQNNATGALTEFSLVTTSGAYKSLSVTKVGVRKYVVNGQTASTAGTCLFIEFNADYTLITNQVVLYNNTLLDSTKFKSAYNSRQLCWDAKNSTMYLVPVGNPVSPATYEQYILSFYLDVDNPVALESNDITVIDTGRDNRPYTFGGSVDYPIMIGSYTGLVGGNSNIQALSSYIQTVADFLQEPDKIKYLGEAKATAAAGGNVNILATPSLVKFIEPLAVGQVRGSTVKVTDKLGLFLGSADLKAARSPVTMLPGTMTTAGGFLVAALMGTPYIVSGLRGKLTLRLLNANASSHTITVGFIQDGLLSYASFSLTGLTGNVNFEWTFLYSAGFFIASGNIDLRFDYKLEVQQEIDYD